MAWFLELCEMWSIPLLLFLPGPLWPGVVVSDRIQSLGQIYLSKDWIRLENVKNLLGNNYTQNLNRNLQWMRFFNL